MKKPLLSIGFALISALALGACTATAYPGYAYSPRPVYYQPGGYHPGAYYPNGYYPNGYYAAPVVTGPTVITRPGWGHGYGG
ncbi:MAG: hypothetical protein Q8S73_15945, partial [Deltaproteobacteria bacterium]|nr:hypothetical protein [Deltaproteobacteria bacterium]